MMARRARWFDDAGCHISVASRIKHHGYATDHCRARARRVGLNVGVFAQNAVQFGFLHYPSPAAWSMVPEPHPSLGHQVYRALGRWTADTCVRQLRSNSDNRINWHCAGLPVD